MDSAHYWEDSNASGGIHHHIKYERCNSADGTSRGSCKEEQSIFRFCDGNLNFATAVTSEDDEFSFHKKKVARDPMSHRIIEKRRRDRMNNCLADLSRLIPADYLKKGRGRIEKTEIIEMAIKHMKHLQTHSCCKHLGACESSQQNSANQENGLSRHGQSSGPIVVEHYKLGYQECLSEAMHFLVEVEGFFAGDPLCVQLINHLQKHCDKIMKGDRLNFPRTNLGETTSSSSGSSGAGSHIPLGTSGVSSASPESGSCSDNSRTEKKDSAIDSGKPPSAPTSVSSAAILTEESSDGLLNLSSQSQLREMLSGQTFTNLNTTSAVRPRLCVSQSNQAQFVHAPLSPGPLALGSNSSSFPSESAGKDRSAASLYKFKNNIKQRFSAEHRPENILYRNEPYDSSRGYEEVVKRKRYDSELSHENGDTNVTVHHALMKRRDSDTCSVSSLAPSPPPAPSSKYLNVPTPSPDPIARSPIARSPVPRPNYLSSPAQGIPIFALDYRGSFYVPLTLDSEVLSPYLAALGFTPESSDSNSIVLHPVTISVNFQQGVRQRMSQNVQHQRPSHLNVHCAPSSPWRNESHGFTPVAKWTYAVADNS